MKSINTILVTLASVCLLAACTDANVDPLTGMYDMDRYTFTSVTVAEPELSGDIKILGLTLSDGSNTMSVTFGSSSYVLPATTYVLADELTAAKQYNGTFNGVAITSGDLDVVHISDVWYLNALMTDATGREFIINYRGAIDFEDLSGDEPTAIELVNLLSASSSVSYGTNSVTVVLATEDVYYGDFDWSTWSYPINGTGNYISIDFYSSDGYLYAGTYTPGDSDSFGEGNFVKGYDPGDIYGWGIEYTNWGTCWFTVEDGDVTAEHLETGTITVKKSDSKYTITVNCGDIYAEYVGAIDDLNPGGDDDDSIQLTQVLSATSNVVYGTNSVTLNIATDGVSYYFDSSTWSNVYEGSGYYLAVDFYSSDGYLYAGTYTAGDSDSLSSGQFAKGYDPGDIYGWGIEYTNWGTCWWTVTDGATSAQHIEDGTIEVSLSGDTYTIVLLSDVANATYTGPIDDLNPNK